MPLNLLSSPLFPNFHMLVYLFSHLLRSSNANFCTTSQQMQEPLSRGCRTTGELVEKTIEGDCNIRDLLVRFLDSLHKNIIAR